MKVFLANFNGVMDEVQKHVNLVPIDDADVILTWQDVEESFIHLSLAAKYLGKKIILLSHCFGSTNDYLPPHSHNSYADKILVWEKLTMP
jgi:chromosomal replication initiation ATPase DnaA